MTDNAGPAATALTTQPAAPPAAAPPAAWHGDEYKDLVANKGWKAPNDVLQSYKGLETLLGADKANRGLVLPKDDTDTAGWDAVHAKLGRPEKPDGYKVPDALKTDPIIGEFSQVAHKAGMSGKQFDAAMGWFTARMDAEGKAAEAADAKAFSEAEGKLKGEWGNAYDANIELARRAVREFGVDVDTASKIEGAIGPAGLLSLFQKIGSRLGEDTAGTAGAGATSLGISPAQARERMAAIRTDPTKWQALTDANHPGHKDLAEQWDMLGKAAAAGGA